MKPSHLYYRIPYTGSDGIFYIETPRFSITNALEIPQCHTKPLNEAQSQYTSFWLTQWNMRAVDIV